MVKDGEDPDEHGLQTTNNLGLTRCTSRNVAPLTGTKKFNFDIIK